MCEDNEIECEDIELAVVDSSEKMEVYGVTAVDMGEYNVNTDGSFTLSVIHKENSSDEVLSANESEDRSQIICCNSSKVVCIS